MNYDAELRLVTDTLKRLGAAVAIHDPTLPISGEQAANHRLWAPGQVRQELPLTQLLPPIADNTVYALTDGLCRYTYLRLPDQQPEALLIIGPYLPEPVTPQKIMEQAEARKMDSKGHKLLTRYYSSLPVLPRSSQLYLMLDAFFDRIWGMDGYTAEEVSREHLPEAASLWFSDREREEADALVDAAIMEERYAHENGLMDAIRQGQIWRVEGSLSRITPAVLEQRLSDKVRDAKNYCIITNTLSRKAAEQGGVHPMYIDSVSSAFAARIEQLTSTAGATALILEIARAYCRLVRSHMTGSYSVPVQKAILHIDGDLSAELTLSSISRHLNVNSSYLSSLFKKETGSTVTDYIATRRINHARHLLESTRLQIQTIAQLCGFEDVHYFSRVFKRITGQTPRQYRHPDK